ncbi:MAG: hypothetical protein V4617_16610 [Gemmatimonadota bacterium]
MHVELAELLRCPNRHTESWLVLAADRTEARVVLDGTLGCPICGAEYAIRDGVTYFAAPSEMATAVVDAVTSLESGDGALRLAALLNVSDAAGTVALVGVPPATARALQALVPMRCLVVDPPTLSGMVSVLEAGFAPLAVLYCDGLLPLPRAGLDGVLVEHPDPRVMSSAVAALRPGGRLVAPVTVDVPMETAELARDAVHWVAERRADSIAPTDAPLVQLRRRR